MPMETLSPADMLMLETGKAIVQLLMLTPYNHRAIKDLKGTAYELRVRFDTAYGTKSFIGLARSIERIQKEEKEKMKIDKKPFA